METPRDTNFWASVQKQRFHGAVKRDTRDDFARDADRILYSSAFRRLGGVTQIVRSGEADVFHTRQQHTYKVAQIGKRLAQDMQSRFPNDCWTWGLSVDCVEAACLAHDLGHPPFGHIAEHALDTLVVSKGDEDGFEGNAQTFRILTKLALRFPECHGLDLTRGTLNAVLKYPWFRDKQVKQKRDKWGAYHSDYELFNFAREHWKNDYRSLEAELMDFADDITYSVHDLEDHHRCGMIPWRRILSGDKRAALLKSAKEKWFDPPASVDNILETALNGVAETIDTWFPEIYSRYEGSREQRFQLRQLSSRLIARLIPAIRFASKHDRQGSITIITPDATAEIRVLKQITKDYIVSDPSLVAQQSGQEMVIGFLFEKIFSKCESTWPSFLPSRLRYLWDLRDGSKARFAADCIASLTEAEALGLYERLTGYRSGSVLDPIAR